MTVGELKASLSELKDEYTLERNLVGNLLIVSEDGEDLGYVSTRDGGVYWFTTEDA